MSDQHQPELSDDELAQLLASLQADDLNPPAPPSSIWEGIQSQLAADDAPSSAQPDVNSTSSTSSAPAAVVPLRPARSSQTSQQSHLDEPVHGERRSSLALRWMAAAAAVIVVVAGVFLVAQRGDDARVVATAQLQYEDGFDAAGASARASATLLERDGRYQIKLADRALPTDLGEAADLELWLIEQRADGSLDVQPVAIIDNGDGTFAVPAGLDPTTHDIVDISIEPRDGDATHSGRSILRGALQQA